MTLNSDYAKEVKRDADTAVEQFNAGYAVLEFKRQQWADRIDEQYDDIEQLSESSHDVVFQQE